MANKPKKNPLFNLFLAEQVIRSFMDQKTLDFMDFYKDNPLPENKEKEETKENKEKE